MPKITAAQMAGNHTTHTPWCSGCGLHHSSTGEHRADCTATQQPACPICLYHPNLHDGRHRADCPHRKANT